MIRLTALTRYALAHAIGIEPCGVVPEVVAELSYESLRLVSGLGKLGRRDVVAWLAEAGLEPAGGMPARKPAVTQARIDDAKALLERCGYAVTKRTEAGKDAAD